MVAARDPTVRNGWALVLLVVGMAACMPSWDAIERAVPEGPRDTARMLFAALRRGDADAVGDVLHPSVSRDEIHGILLSLAPLLAGSEPEGVRFGSWMWVYRDSRQQHQLMYEIRTGSRFLVVYVALEEHEGEPLVAEIGWREFDTSPIEANRFALERKPPLHYAMLGAGVAVPALCLASFVVCWRRRPRRRWLWLVSTLVAAPVLSLNWTSGEIDASWLSFNLFGAGFNQAGPLQPMFLKIGFPIGALVFLVVRPRSAGGEPGPAFREPDPSRSGSPDEAASG